MKLPVDYNKMTPRERKAVREEYMRLQENKCIYCGCLLSHAPAKDVRRLPIDWTRFPGGESFLRFPVHLQHNHGTGMTEGAVHAYCNAVLWQYYRR